MSNDATGTAIYALTKQGGRVGGALAQAMGGRLYMPARLADEFQAAPFDSLADLVSGQFSAFPRHIFVSATGVAVRLIAPHLASKTTDPAVVVVDQQARHVISLVSGHIGGANDLAREAAAILGAEAVITTGTDAAGAPAVDTLAVKAGLRFAHPGKIKHVNARLADGETVWVQDPENWLRLDRLPAEQQSFFRPAPETTPLPATPGVVVSWKTLPLVEERENILLLRPPCLTVGVGYRKGVDAETIRQCLEQTLQLNALALEAVLGFGTHERKRHDPGLQEAAQAWAPRTQNAVEQNAGVTYFSTQELNTVTVPNPSAMPDKYLGAPSVSEAAALLLSQGGELLLEKTVCKNVTLAVGKRPRP